MKINNLELIEKTARLIKSPTDVEFFRFFQHSDD